MQQTSLEQLPLSDDGLVKGFQTEFLLGVESRSQIGDELIEDDRFDVAGEQLQHEPVADATTPIYEIHLIPNVQPIEGAVLCRSVLNKRKHELTVRNRFPREETPDRAHSGWLDDAARTSADRAGTTAADGTRKPNRSAPPKR